MISGWPVASQCQSSKHVQCTTLSSVVTCRLCNVERCEINAAFPCHEGHEVCDGFCWYTCCWQFVFWKIFGSFEGVVSGWRVPPEMTRRSAEGCLHPAELLQIRNNSDRCWKAIEHLIFMRKCSWKWPFCGSHIAGIGNKRCSVRRQEVFKITKNEVNPCKVTIFARGQNCCVQHLFGSFELLIIRQVAPLICLFARGCHLLLRTETRFSLFLIFFPPKTPCFIPGSHYMIATQQPLPSAFPVEI